ncbi:McrB family protein [Paraburkholderia caledonica]|uniref:5-methylcytosine-specific restriction protein B n=1 Tax=Paraburkholderia caledonica TaxID=134536 RepID=A0AB73I628_9BURK|nr:5-methylcytosine-specific restriction protein B [Paraburkholderia caledonica]
MTTILSDDQLREIWQTGFKTYATQQWATEWRHRYTEQLRLVKDTSRDIWLTPDFQAKLWNDNPIANIGSGNSVTVPGALPDKELASHLLNERDAVLPYDAEARGEYLDALYKRILAWIAKKQYAKRRPKARLIRLFAAIFPDDMVCLMNARRIWQVQRLIGLRPIHGDFVAQHAVIRDHLRQVLGQPATVEESVDQSVLTWYLWQTYIDHPDEGAVEQPKVTREAVDIPEISFLPAEAQRRSLTCVRDNVSLLVAVVRETEQGLSRDDLISVIMQEAPQLQKSTSAVNVISQAQGGLGLITLTDGAYRPTTRGIDILAAPDPADALRGPLIGRVFGMGHLLLWLSQTPDGIAHQELASRLQELVPTWTTTQPSSYIIAWARMVGLVRSDSSTGHIRLILTEDGEDYAAALPEDFEARWQIHIKKAETDAETFISGLSVVDDNGLIVAPSYSIQAIVDDGCFVPADELNAMLELLKRKRNLILQGPPGTGKTWLAKRLGYALLAARSTSRLVSLQFQPSLSYEDFVRGWRPGADGRLDLVDGVFLEAINEAQADPSPLVVVIEEINRGNPAQVFGEMLTLLEHDKRRADEALRPAYARSPDERIYIPPNLYVIGTMNIADRSLALIDLALRRRFAFATLRPALGSPWRDWCRTHAGFSDAAVTDIAERMERLNHRIASDQSLGDQFCIGHSFVTPQRNKPIEEVRAWFGEIVKSELEPLLREYWYDNPPKVKEAIDELVTDL